MLSILLPKNPLPSAAKASARRQRTTRRLKVKRRLTRLNLLNPSDQLSDEAPEFSLSPKNRPVLFVEGENGPLFLCQRK